MENKKNNPFGLSDKELEKEVDVIKDDMMCELENDDCDFGYLMDRVSDLDSLGVDIFSLF